MMFQVDNIYAVPILHYKMEFASEVYRIFHEVKPDCVAVELPETLSEHFLHAAARLPDISLLVSEKPGKAPLYTMCEPCDPTFEALRCAHEAQKEAFCIDLEVSDYPDFHEPFPDTYTILKIGFEKYYEACKNTTLKKPKHPLDIKRELYMARRLKELSLLYDKVLFVGGFYHVEDVLAQTKRNSFPQQHHDRSSKSVLCTLTELSTRECMAEFGWNTMAYEESRSLLDRQKLAFDLYKSVGISGSTLQNTLKYARNLSLLKSTLTPGLYEIVTAAKGCAGQKSAYDVYLKATEYPLRKNVDELPELDLTIEELWGFSKYINFKFKETSRKQSLHSYTPSPFTLCSYPKEDVFIEQSAEKIKKKAQEKVLEAINSTIAFKSSLEEGIDIRETVRKWFEKKLYVKVGGPDCKKPGTIVVIYDEDLNENYPWKMTWIGENDQESDMAFYATAMHKNIVGPGMARCEYGGFLMTSPRGRLMDIWNDPDYFEFETKAEILLAAAIDYSMEPHVVYIAKKPPTQKMKRFAARFGKKIVYLPIGTILKKVRTFHVLDSHDKRKIADEYIF